MAVREILLLGNPVLHRVCEPIAQAELVGLGQVVTDLHDTLLDFRSRHGIGRAIAAPQIGVTKRLVYLFINEPVVFINPIISAKSAEMFDLWDDCMSFPDLLVRVARHRTCQITYRDLDWQEQTRTLTDSLSELLQHECDHLDGILAVARAIDSRFLALKSQSRFL